MKWMIGLLALLVVNGVFQISYGSTVDLDLIFREGMDSAIYGNFALDPLRQIFQSGVWVYAPDYYAQRVLPGVLVHLGLKAFGYQEITRADVVMGFQWLSLFCSAFSLFLFWRISRALNVSNRTFALVALLFFLSPFLTRKIFYYPVMNDAFGMLLFFGILHGYLRGRAWELVIYSLASAFTWSLLGMVGMLFLLFPKIQPLCPVEGKKRNYQGLFAFLSPFFLLALAIAGKDKPYHNLSGQWLTFGSLVGFALLLFQSWSFSYLLLSRTNVLRSLAPNYDWVAALKRLFSWRLVLVFCLLLVKQLWVGFVTEERTQANLIPLLYAIGGAVRAPWMSLVSVMSVFGIWTVVVFRWWREIRSAFEQMGLGFFLAALGLLILGFDTEGRHQFPLIQMLSVLVLLALDKVSLDKVFWLPVVVASLVLSRFWLMQPVPENYGDVHMQIDHFFMNSANQSMHVGIFAAALAYLVWHAGRVRSESRAF